MEEISQRVPDEVVRLARARIRSLSFWSIGIWWCYIIGKIISYTTGILVPFGLAVLLYLPKERHMYINVALLVLSFVSIATQVILDSLRFRDRALRLRKLHRRLEVEFARFQSGLSDVASLATVIEKNKDEFLEKDLP